MEVNKVQAIDVCTLRNKGLAICCPEVKNKEVYFYFPSTICQPRVSTVQVWVQLALSNQYELSPLDSVQVQLYKIAEWYWKVT